MQPQDSADTYKVDVAATKKRSARLPLTYRCNLKCLYCFWNKSRKENLLPQQYNSNDMDFDLACRLIDHLAGHVQALVLYDGGEPLLYSRLDDLIRYAKQRIPFVTTTTNGILLTKEKSKQLAEAGLDSISVSIDGADVDYNKKMRGINLDQILKNTEQFSLITNKPVTLTAVCTMDNLNTIETMLAWKKIIPTFRAISLNTIGGTYNHRKSLNGVIKARDAKVFKRHMKKCCAAAEISLFFECFHDESINKVWGDPCRMPWSGLISISMQGDLMPCSRIHHLPLANILSNGLMGAINSDKARQFRSEILNGIYCEICCKTCRYPKTVDSFLDRNINIANYI